MLYSVRNYTANNLQDTIAVGRCFEGRKIIAKYGEVGEVSHLKSMSNSKSNQLSCWQALSANTRWLVAINLFGTKSILYVYCQYKRYRFKDLTRSGLFKEIRL